MKKIISVLALVLIMLMLEFNFFKGCLPNTHVWFETILAFVVLAAVILWNNFHKRNPVK